MYPESHWNYRVLAFTIDGDVYFDIREVHYRHEKPELYSTSSSLIESDSIKSLNWTLNRMKEALKKPILWGDERFPPEYKPETK